MSFFKFVLSRKEILKNIDNDLSFKESEAIKYMDMPSLYGDGDVGRLMQIQQFNGGSLFDSGLSSHWGYFKTWSDHYKSTRYRDPLVPDDEKFKDKKWKIGCPFIVVRVSNKNGRPVIIIYKFREVIEDPSKKKHYQMTPGAKERQKMRNREAREIRKKFLS